MFSIISNVFNDVNNVAKFIGKDIVNYFKFISKQLTQLQPTSYGLWTISFFVQLYILIQSGINPISVVTFFGTNLGVLCVVAINSAKSVNGLLGLLSGACFIIVGFSAKNYLSIGEQIAYMTTLDLPVIISPTWNKNLVSKIRKFTHKDWVISIAFTAVIMVGSALLMSAFTNDPRPWFDALAFSVSLTGGIVCFLRYSNQYYWWLAGSICQLVLWTVTLYQGGANAGMLMNCLIYLSNDVLAFTVSPWFNKRTQEKDLKAERANN